MPTNPPNITALPTPPDPNDRSSFNVRAYPWSVAQQTLATEVAAVAANVKGNADEAVAAAGTAGMKANEAFASQTAAAASAASALNAPGTTATSSSSLTVGSGLKSLALAQTGKAFSVGQRVVIARTSAASTVRMVGYLEVADPATGNLAVRVGAADFLGDGTYTDWTVSMAGEGNNLQNATVADAGKLLGVLADGHYGLVAGRGTGAGTASPNAQISAAALVVSAVQSIVPTGFGQWVKLPPATGITPGVGVATLVNAGNWDVAILNDGGATLGFIESRKSVAISLQDNTTSNGVWAIGGVKHMSYWQKHIANSNVVVREVIELDSGRELVICVSGGSIYGVVWNLNTSTLGTWTLLKSGYTMPRAIKTLVADQVVLVSQNGANSMHVNVLSISGSSISVGANAAVSIGAVSNDPSPFYDLINVAGQGVAISTQTSTSGNSLYAVTISGTTATVGTGVGISNVLGQCPIFDLGGGRVLVFAYSSGSTAQVYTMSGTSLAAGTAYPIPSQSTQFFHVRLLPSGRFMYVTNNGASLISVSGTTPSSLGYVAFSSAYANIICKLMGNSVVVLACDASSTNTYMNVVTDNAGTLVQGSPTVLGIAGTTGTYPMRIYGDAMSFVVGLASNPGSTSRNAVKLTLSGGNVVPEVFFVPSQAVADGGYGLYNSIAYKLGKDELTEMALESATGSYAVGAGYYAQSTMGKFSGSSLEFVVRPPVGNNSSYSYARTSGDYLWMGAGGTLVRMKVATA